MIRLYGTITSPYVRRVRVVADELGLPCELLESASAEGQARLRAHSPIWKVPAAEIDGQLVLDSHTITELLLARHGAGKLAPLPIDDLEARNAIAVIDGAVDSLINAFYLSKEGVSAESVPYMKKQNERAASALEWLETRMHGSFVTSRKQYGLPEIALGTTIGWMLLRNAYPIARHPRLMACYEQLQKRPSFVASQPLA
jgi:glutathione S-transferase